MRLLRHFISNILILLLILALLNPAVLPPGLQQGFFNAQSWIIERLPENIVFPYTPHASTPIQASTAEISSAVDKVSPAVITVLGSRGSFTGVTRVTTGTGFIVHKDGYIVTNKHVVAETNVSYRVILANKRTRMATVIYRHPTTDLAVLKIDGTNYPVAALGNSGTLKIGQPILAIGNSPHRTDNRLSVGQISGLRRSIFALDSNSEKLRNVIQTSVQLFEGDSGGPLFNLKGEIVGVNVATAAAFDSVSFAIPINEVTAVLPGIIP